MVLPKKINSYLVAVVKRYWSVINGTTDEEVIL